MATITKITGKIDNKELPIITENGFVTNYYFGKFVNILSEKGVSVEGVDRTAIETFINKGIQENWLSLVKYYTIFYGTEDVKEAALVPLIDNVDDYNMSEVNENFNESIFNVSNGKIIGLGSDSNSIATYIPTPVLGNCYMFSSFKTPLTLGSSIFYYVSKRSTHYVNSIRKNSSNVQIYYNDYSGIGTAGGGYTLVTNDNYQVLFGVKNTSSTKGTRRRIIYKNGIRGAYNDTTGIDAYNTTENESDSYKYDILTRNTSDPVFKGILYSAGFLDTKITLELADKFVNAVLELELALGKYQLHEGVTE